MFARGRSMMYIEIDVHTINWTVTRTEGEEMFSIRPGSKINKTLFIDLRS